MADSLREQIEAILDHAAFWEDGQNVSGTLDKIMAAIDDAWLDR